MGAALRGLAEGVCVVAALRGLQKGVVRQVAGLGRHDGHLLWLALEGIEVVERVVGLVVEVVGEARVGEVSRGCGVVHGVKGVVGREQIGVVEGLVVGRMRRGGGRVP